MNKEEEAEFKRLYPWLNPKDFEVKTKNEIKDERSEEHERWKL